jgi:glycosyltransferase involved in cell wall biosynthesis
MGIVGFFKRRLLNEKEMKVVIIGQSVERSPGGIASVIKGQLDSAAADHDIQYYHIETHVEGSVLERIAVFAKSLITLIFTRNISVAHIHSACDGSFYRKAIASIVCRIKGVPVIIHIHGADFDRFYNKSWPVLKTFIRGTLRRSKRVIVLSSYWKAFFHDAMGLTNVIIIYNGVNTNAFANCDTVPQNIKSFLFLGRLGERKGVYDLLKAIDKLVNQENLRDLKFFLAGDGEIEEVKNLATQLQLGNNVEVVGWADAKLKMELLHRTDTVVLPSYNEGLPVALLEAMAAGKIILSTIVGGIPDLVTENVNGFLITPGDVHALAEKIRYIIQHPAEMVTISANNREKITNEFNIVNINKELFKLYHDVVAGN